MTDSEDELDRAYEALSSQDWAKLRLLLHPYVRFTGPDGVKTRGRTKVLAILSSQAGAADLGGAAGWSDLPVAELARP